VQFGTLCRRGGPAVAGWVSDCPETAGGLTSDAAAPSVPWVVEVDAAVGTEVLWPAQDVGALRAPHAQPQRRSEEHDEESSNHELNVGAPLPDQEARAGDDCAEQQHAVGQSNAPLQRLADGPVHRCSILATAGGRRSSCQHVDCGASRSGFASRKSSGRARVAPAKCGRIRSGSRAGRDSSASFTQGGTVPRPFFGANPASPLRCVPCIPSASPRSSP
jgi:hypothetical protein